MSLTTITFDDENSGPDINKPKLSPKPPSKPGGVVTMRPGLKRPMPKRINSSTQDDPNIRNPPKSISTKIPQASPSSMSSQKQNKQSIDSPQNKYQKDDSNYGSDYDYYDYYDEESNNKNTNSIHSQLLPRQINTTKSPYSAHSQNQQKRIISKQSSNQQNKQKNETQYSSESYSYSESEPNQQIQTRSPPTGSSQTPNMRKNPVNPQFNTPSNIRSSNSDISRSNSNNLNINNRNNNGNNNIDSNNNIDNNNSIDNNNENINKTFSNNNNINDTSSKTLNVDSNQNVVPIPTNISVKRVLNDPVSYRLKRSSTVSLHGKMTHYQLYLNGRQLLHTKLKTKKASGICYIGEGAELHLSRKDYLAAILYANNCSTFSIRKTNEYGEEILTIIYKPGIDGSPRNVQLFFPKIFKNIPQKLFSRNAVLSDTNSWTLDMKGKFTIKSIKNCVLVDEYDNEFVYVMKIDKETLQIDVDKEFSELMVFSIGLSSFFCKL